MSFADVNTVVVPAKCIVDTHAHLQRVGRRGNEGFVLWVGKPEGTTFRVMQAVIPAQVALVMGGGVCVTVDGRELHRINVWLHENGWRLIAQIHSHPTDAYHSDTDDAYPIATTEGCLSLVLPDFASSPFHLRDCAVYRLLAGARWAELSPEQAAALIRIE